MYIDKSLSAHSIFDPATEKLGAGRAALRILCAIIFSSFALTSGTAEAQVNVLTAHNDIARTGQNLSEIVLNPSNVNDTQFGKLFSQTISGSVYAQPLYVSQVNIPGLGTHNVVYVATTKDRVYAFDADDNGGSNASPLWSVSFLTNPSAPAGSTVNFGIVGTPVIDPIAGLLYLVSSEAVGTTDIFRLHALDITTGAEELGGPVMINASIPGTGSGSSAGVLSFNAGTQYQRPGLLLLNGVIYVAFGSVNDNGAWHGWIFSYSASTLQQLNFLCTSPNGSAAGIWMGGSGLAADVPDPINKPFGRMFVVTGNGTYKVSKPYTSSQSYSMSVLDLDLTGGLMSVSDMFTPSNYLQLNGQDGDLGSGGAILPPPQTLGSGSTLNPLIQMGKGGTLYVIDRNNLGGFNASGDQVIQEVQTPQFGPNNWGIGVWGAPAYWNNNLYFGGAQYAQYGSRVGSALSAYSFLNGQASTAPTSQSSQFFAYPGPTPSVSSNGTSNGIVWVLKADAYPVGGQNILLAYDATNLANQLYSSNDNPARDAPGVAVKFVPPTVANGKVYVGTNGTLSVYGLLIVPTAATPVITPGSGSFLGSQSVSISDATSGAQVYYTTDGSIPTVSSIVYTGPITVTATGTVTAIASAPGYLQSGTVSASYSSITSAANPVFSLAPGSYVGSQILTLTDPTPGAVIYYTLDESTPTTISPIYSKPLSIPVSETIRAFAVAPLLTASPTVSASYVITPPYAIDFSQGFSQAAGPMQFNGSTGLDDFRLQLTNGGTGEAASAFYITPVNIQSFTTDFTFQLSNPAADGFTFTIQNIGPGAIGASGGGLGYQGIGSSVAIKFDLFNNAGEGSNSTGIYVNGAAPTQPSFGLNGTGIDLHNGSYTNVHITYDGTHLNLTLTNTVTLATWTKMFSINIPSVVGGPTAYVGFTGSTSAQTSSQKLTSWTYLAGPPPVPDYPAGFDNTNLVRRGSALYGTALRLSNGTAFPVTSTYYSSAVAIGAFTTDFQFQITKATADGFAFVIQNQGTSSRGSGGGGLGYATIPNSVAIKFDFFNNAGEGTDSTGIYLNGVMPTVPSADLTPTGLQLNNGDIIQAHITYDGATLTWTLTDLTSPQHPTTTQQAPVNLPNIIGSNIAYVGFTASSGDGTSIQSILNWGFHNP